MKDNKACLTIVQYVRDDTVSTISPMGLHCTLEMPKISPEKFNFDICIEPLITRF